MPDQLTCNIQTALDAGKALSQPIVAESPVAAVVLPQGYKVEALERHLECFRPAPRRITANVTLHDADSFIAYVKDFKTDHARIFANIPGGGPPSFMAVLDYHSTQPHWCSHRALFVCRFTQEWDRWMAKDRQHMSQMGLAEFLEENQQLVVEPPGAELLELVQTLEGSNAIRYNSIIRLSNGKAKVLYEEEVELKGTVTTRPGEIEFPTGLVVAIAPFEGGQPYRVRCRLKYRLSNRSLEFWFETIDPHLIMRDAVDAIIDEIIAETEIAPFMGAFLADTKLTQ